MGLARIRTRGSSTRRTRSRPTPQGNVYVADQGNKRIQVFDNGGTFKAQIANIGVPTALCISRGPHQYLFSSHTGDPYGMDDAAIYKLELDGRIVGRFGKAGKLPKELGLVNALDCRTENELFVGELSNWRVQKLRSVASGPADRKPVRMSIKRCSREPTVWKLHGGGSHRPRHPCQALSCGDFLTQGIEHVCSFVRHATPRRIEVVEPALGAEPLQDLRRLDETDGR